MLLVHGGPWARDTWGYNPLAQWLANRGYAVLQVNYRGSTGYGKKFLNAGNREWAGKMHHDLLDGVEWLVKQGVADPKKVAIMGGSYGGYATLVGLTFTPDVFACGVDIVGPSNIVTLLKTIPPYWAPVKAIFAKRVGDLEKEEEFLNGAVAAVQGEQDHEAAADRPGGERPAREAGGERSDRRGDAEERQAGASTCCTRTRATASRGRRTGCTSSRSASSSSPSTSAAAPNRSARSRGTRGRSSKTPGTKPGTAVVPTASGYARPGRPRSQGNPP